MTQLALPKTFPFDDPTLGYHVTQMQVADLEPVMEIERQAFSAPWPASAYRYELTQNDLSIYLVLNRRGTRRRLRWLNLRQEKALPAIVAYGGFWNIVDEAHISTIAVHSEWRGQRLGELMLVSLIDAAALCRANEVTLEVRVSNHVAQKLYLKYGFVEVGRRKRYYHDNQEDALIMTLGDLNGADHQIAYACRKRALFGALIARADDSDSRGGKGGPKDVAG